MKARTWLNLGLLLSGVGSAGSGLTLQIRYHMHHLSRLAGTGWDFPTWLLFHRVTSVLLLVLVTWHLVLNWKWVRAVWTQRLFYKHKQLTSLSLFFAASVLTGLAAWCLGLTSIGTYTERPIIEIHDKLTLFLCGFLLLHIWDRRRRLVILRRA